MRKPKVVFLGATPPPYMGPTVATEIILRSNLRDKVELIHLDTSDRRSIDYLGLIDFWNIYLACKQYWVLLKLVITRRPDAVYIPVCQTTVGYLRDSGYVLIAKLFRCKVVCHLRGGNFLNWYQSCGGLMKFFVRCIHSMVDGQIVLGESLRHLFTPFMDNSKIYVIPNARDFPEITTDIPKSPDTLKILYLANFIRSKGVLDTLHSIPFVTSEHPNVQFIFAGKWADDATKQEFEEFQQQHPQLPVYLKGPVYDEDKYTLFQEVDIFVFPTYYPAEGHPWVIVEAMAYGLPIISTDQGCIKESVIDNDNGFIVPSQNPRAIAEKLNQLIGDTQLRNTMAQRSRELYLQNLTEQKMVDRYASIFSAVCSQ